MADTTVEASFAELLTGHVVLALATCAPDQRVPYPAAVFYAVAPDPGGALLLFMSDPGSRHARDLGDGPTQCAASIYRETERLGEIHGAQILGEVVPCRRLATAERARLLAIYAARHAALLAAAGPRAHELYVLAPTWVKLTDNRIGFGRHPELRFATPWSRLGLVLDIPSAAH